MGERYVSAVGCYLPLVRLDRKAAASALRWTGLGGPRSGRRAVAGWDEDALTLAVEAARAAGGIADQVIFASTSAYFTERSQAGLLVEALALPEGTQAFDVANSRRCGVSALLQALRSDRRRLVVAGERRPTKAGSAAQLSFGDGAAAAVADD
jgi:3-hydroxy-3-methylglutaryl CoA synthase